MLRRAVRAEEPGQGVAASTRRARPSRGHLMKTCSKAEEAVSSTMLAQTSARVKQRDGRRWQTATVDVVYLDHACQEGRRSVARHFGWWHGKTTRALTEHDSGLWTPQLACEGFASHDPRPGGLGLQRESTCRAATSMLTLTTKHLPSTCSL